MTLLVERERICRRLWNPDWLARSLADQAILLAEKLGQPRKALKLAEEAHQLAAKNGLMALERQLASLLQFLSSSPT
jgi:hypothetical protein